MEALSSDAVRAAGLVAFYLPMHTATRLAAPVIEKVKRFNAAAHLCCYGLYAPLNESYLRKLGVRTILGGEFEPGLVSLAERLSQGSSGSQTEPLIGADRLQLLRRSAPGFRRLTKNTPSCGSMASPSEPDTPRSAGAASICAGIVLW